MLGYFPAIYPGELLYSVLARWARHTGRTGVRKTNADLFNYDGALVSIDLPNRLEVLAAKIPKERGLTASRLARRYTLFPYYRATAALHLSRRMLRLMMSGQQGKGSLVTSRHGRLIPRPTLMRFCPECSAEMAHEHGELYWLRVHQLPTVLVCPRHACPLSESTALAGWGYQAATRSNCATTQPLINASRSQREDLHRLARLTADLLESGRNRDPDRSHWIERYRERCALKGLLRREHGVETAKLSKEVEERFDHLAAIWPKLFPVRGWLTYTTTANRTLQHPIYTFLIETTLDGLADVDPRETPFGRGPWPCLNATSDHYGALVINDMSWRRTKGFKLGRFACSLCQHSYLKRLNKDGTSGRHRTVSYGNCLESFVLDRLASGRSIAEIAKEAKMGLYKMRRVIDQLADGRKS